MQRFSRLQEGKLILCEIDELRRKETIISSRTQLWTEDISQVNLSMHSNLKGMHQTQRTMSLAVEGPTIEKLVEEVQQAVA